MGLLEDKKQYVDYILKVAEVCEVNDPKLNYNKLISLSLKELDEMSIEAENLYEVDKSVKRLDRVLMEIDELGIEYVKEYYNFK